MSTTPLRGIVFDLDGTLIDSYPAITESVNHARRSLDQQDLSVEAVRSYVGRGLESLMVDVVGESNAAEGVRLFRERYAEVYRTGTELLEGVAETLPKLRDAGLRMTIASNKPARFGRDIADAFGLLPWLDAVHGPDTVGKTKPDPTMIQRCLSEMELAVDDAIYVGDMTLDVTSGERAGIDTWLVATGSATRDELEQTGRPVFGTLPELAAKILAR